MNDVLNASEARLNLTIAGQNSDLVDSVPFDADDGQIKSWATEAVRSGNIPGVAADVNANFDDFVVDRFAANEIRPYNLIQIRPKVHFG